jgi:hypothetical protein
MADDDSILSDPPLHDEPIPALLQVDGAAEPVVAHGLPNSHTSPPEHPDHPEHPPHHDNMTEEPNQKKRKRYNDPPQGKFSRSSIIFFEEVVLIS